MIRLKKILTVVVPAYNAEAYLRKNLESFRINEVLDQIEILVVNDGSTDYTRQIAESYVHRYPDSYRLISKENGGHGSGINCGIRNAAGLYFKVVDADDWVEKTAFTRLVWCLREQAEREHPADIVSSGFLWAVEQKDGASGRFRLRAEFKEPFRGVEYGKTYQFDRIADSLYIKMHNMTIRTEILRGHGIRIDEHCYYVDSEYITYPIPWVETVCFVDAYVYRYRIGRRGQSIGMDRMRQQERDYDRVIASLLAFYDRLGSEIPCSREKKAYTAGLIARVVAGRVKAALSFPASEERKRELVSFDERIRSGYPEVYGRNRNRAVGILRRSGYAAYLPASLLVKRIYG